MQKIIPQGVPDNIHSGTYQMSRQPTPLNRRESGSLWEHLLHRRWKRASVVTLPHIHRFLSEHQEHGQRTRDLHRTLAAAAAALQSISRHKRCKDRDEVVFPSFSWCRQALRSTYTKPEAFHVIHCEIRWRTETECMWQKCEQQQQGSKGSAEMHGTGLGQAKWPANPPAY